MGNKRYLIVCQARTGSTMLSSALERHPQICGHGEVLNQRRDDRLEIYGLNYSAPGGLHDFLREEKFRSPSAFIDKYIFYQGRFSAVGFKFKYEELENPLLEDAAKYVVRNKDINIIHMARENIFKRYVSEYIALNVTKEFNSSDKAIEVNSEGIELDVAEIERAMKKSRYWWKKYRAMFSSHEGIVVTYEQFLANPDATFRNVTNFLGVDDFEFNPATKRVNSPELENLIVNYSDIEKYFANSEFAGFF